MAALVPDEKRLVLVCKKAFEKGVAQQAVIWD